jgi:hypothetical protein
MTGNPCDAEDLVRETMTRAYTGLQNFTPGTSARAWLRRIMANTFANTCRTRHRKVVQVLRPELDASLPVGYSGSGVPRGRAWAHSSADLSSLGFRPVPGYRGLASPARPLPVPDGVTVLATTEDSAELCAAAYRDQWATRSQLSSPMAYT